jgi:hypothetical protein
MSEFTTMHETEPEPDFDLMAAMSLCDTMDDIVSLIFWTMPRGSPPSLESDDPWERVEAEVLLRIEERAEARRQRRRASALGTLPTTES